MVHLNAFLVLLIVSCCLYHLHLLSPQHFHFASEKFLDAGLFRHPSVDDFSFDGRREEIELQDSAEISWGDIVQFAEFSLGYVWIFLKTLFVFSFSKTQTSPIT